VVRRGSPDVSSLPLVCKAERTKKRLVAQLSMSVPKENESHLLRNEDCSQ
jgi:hypothetical protein